ncbi:MAG: transcription-repair coupling factor [Actinobacteria bacterium]|nr:transcription-repair coupling factor [Actinomycetota bacterium]
MIKLFKSLIEPAQNYLSENDNLIAPAAVHGFLAAISNTPLLIITTSTRHAEELSQEIGSWIGKDLVVNFPAWETLPHERLSPKADTVTARFKALNKISDQKVKVIVCSVRALLQPIIANNLNTSIIKIQQGLNLQMQELMNQLIRFGFSRSDLVERRGDFAVRGGILDIFPADQDHPIRVDFFGDEIEELSYFSISDQRSLEKIKVEVSINPCREMLIDEKLKQKARTLGKDFPEIKDLTEKICEGILFEGMESLAAGLVDDFKSITDYLSPSTQIWLIDEPRIKSRAIDLLETNNEFLQAAWSTVAWSDSKKIEAPIELSNKLKIGGFYELDYIKQQAEKKKLLLRTLNLYSSDPEDKELNYLDEIESYANKYEKAILDIKSWKKQGYVVVFTAAATGILQRFSEVLNSSEIANQQISEFDQSINNELIWLIKSDIHHGFISSKYKFVLVTDKDLSGQKSSDKDLARMPSKRRKAIDPLQLNSGDYVVHEQHGVGRYLELITRTTNGASREYLVIEYAPSKRGHPADRIFVPTDTLEQVTKYVGGESPTLHKIGGSDWQSSKRKARKAVKQIAAELIRLYAARMSAPGFAFSVDTTWQKELENSFPFVETVDQQATIDEVKRDMEKPNPMDRIVCGDVGYGKTEIAVRAAFKAVQDGKQVAILVPTTLLVQQHFKTFSARYSGFPIRLAALSRFNTVRESKEIISNLKSGVVDVVIGTHRLLSKDVEFRDLGLLVVDEEQRFGVEHKEELKKARTNVDVLSMSATPIPRTLEMAISGIREMSNITTPPEERHPVLTYVGPYDDKQVSAAIHRELLRDGQVFYIHNRVESIELVSEKIKSLVPGIKIGIAHGQMNEKLLEDVILAFWNREYDLLLCTTIIESGIDIPNANTLIVDRSDLFGLSQLHQLRGRVGRSRERAYAYFLYPTEQPISELAHDRLTTIATNTDLGAGMQVALKDLEIRGAGNLLGGEQSGHIAEVGFDLYMRMVADAVDEFKSGYFEDKPKKQDCKIELPLDAHLPTDYVDSERLRLDIYRRLADAASYEVLTEIEEELIDRFGPLPMPAKELIAVASLRLLAKNLEIADISMVGKNLRLSPVDLAESGQIKLSRLYPGSIYKNASQTLLVSRPTTANWIDSPKVGNTSTLTWVNEVITNLIKPNNKISSH